MVLEITDVRFTPATAMQVATGLMGHLSCVMNGRMLHDGWTLRRTRGGVYSLSYPTRSDGSGRKHPLVRPLGCGTRELIEQQVFDELRKQGHLP